MQKNDSIEVVKSDRAKALSVTSLECHVLFLWCGEPVLTLESAFQEPVHLGNDYDRHCQLGSQSRPQQGALYDFTKASRWLHVTKSR